MTCLVGSPNPHSYLPELPELPALGFVISRIPGAAKLIEAAGGKPGELPPMRMGPWGAAALFATAASAVYERLHSPKDSIVADGVELYPVETDPNTGLDINLPRMTDTVRSATVVSGVAIPDDVTPALNSVEWAVWQDVLNTDIASLTSPLLDVIDTLHHWDILGLYSRIILNWKVATDVLKKLLQREDTIPLMRMGSYDPLMQLSLLYWAAGMPGLGASAEERDALLNRAVDIVKRQQDQSVIVHGDILGLVMREWKGEHAASQTARALQMKSQPGDRLYYNALAYINGFLPKVAIIRPKGIGSVDEDEQKIIALVQSGVIHPFDRWPIFVAFTQSHPSVPLDRILDCFRMKSHTKWAFQVTGQQRPLLSQRLLLQADHWTADVQRHAYRLLSDPMTPAADTIAILQQLHPLVMTDLAHMTAETPPDSVQLTLVGLEFLAQWQDLSGTETKTVADKLRQLMHTAPDAERKAILTAYVALVRSGYLSESELRLGLNDMELLASSSTHFAAMVTRTLLMIYDWIPKDSPSFGRVAHLELWEDRSEHLHRIPLDVVRRSTPVFMQLPMSGWLQIWYGLHFGDGVSDPQLAMAARDAGLTPAELWSPFFDKKKMQAADGVLKEFFESSRRRDLWFKIARSDNAQAKYHLRTAIRDHLGSPNLAADLPTLLQLRQASLGKPEFSEAELITDEEYQWLVTTSFFRVDTSDQREKLVGCLDRALRHQLLSPEVINGSKAIMERLLYSKYRRDGMRVMELMTNTGHLSDAKIQCYVSELVTVAVHIQDESLARDLLELIKRFGPRIPPYQRRTATNQLGGIFKPEHRKKQPQ